MQRKVWNASQISIEETFIASLVNASVKSILISRFRQTAATYKNGALEKTEEGKKELKSEKVHFWQEQLTERPTSRQTVWNDFAAEKEQEKRREEEERRRKSVDKETKKEWKIFNTHSHNIKDELQNDFRYQIWFENELS